MPLSIATPEGVKSLRAKLGWSQRRLAQELGIAVSTIARWEIQQTKPSPSLIKKLYEISTAHQSQAEASPSKYIQAGPERLEYFDVGQGSETLLMVHGHFSTARLWTLSLLESSLADFHIIALNSRGAGQSSRSQGPTAYSVESLSTELFHFVTALGLKRFTLVGHSVGGAVITRFALAYKSLVKSLVLVNTVPLDGSPMGTGKVQIERSVRDQIRTGDPQLQDMGLHAPHLSSEFVRAMRKDFKEMEVDRVIGGIKSMAELKLRKRLSELALPVLVIGGDRDSTVRIESNLNDYMALQGESRFLHIFHGVGHCPPVEVPHDFAQVVADFVRGRHKGRCIVESRTEPV